ncbi:MAG: glycosyltransferase family 39 protein [Pseudomonadota bacterium]|nr:glycosyltransferase family 39 protein [Pseudomonadota bacterium]
MTYAKIENNFPSRMEWLALIAIFLMVGTVGHDPWRNTEPYTFGIIDYFYATHTWLVPVNAGLPFLEKPPLYFWTATIFCRLFGSLLPLHDAARLASVLYMALTTLFTWKISQLFFIQHPDRRTLGWISIALLLGSVGLIRYAHELATDVSLLSGSTIAFYGMALLACRPESWRQAGIWIGLGVGVAFMSKGLLVPGILAIAGLAAWITLPSLHTQKTIKALAVSLIIAAPFFLVWPTLIYLHSPEMFMEWFWENNIGRFVGFSVNRLSGANQPFYFLRIVPWFAFPAFPLACAAAVMGMRTEQRNPAYILPLTISVAGMAVLLISASGREPYLLPLFPPFALLAAPVMLRLPARFLIGWNRAMIVIFTLGSAIVWLAWWNLKQPSGKRPLPWFADFAGQWLPIGYLPADSQQFAIAIAVIIALLWIISFRFPTRSSLSTAYIWFMGAFAVWGTISTLLMPWIDETRSYRHVFAQMREAVHHSSHPHAYIGSYNYNESVSPMFEYFTATPPPAQYGESGNCSFLFAITERNAPQPMGPQWHLLWKGTRPLDEKNEELRLYENL